MFATGIPRKFPLPPSFELDLLKLGLLSLDSAPRCALMVSTDEARVFKVSELCEVSRCGGIMVDKWAARVEGYRAALNRSEGIIYCRVRITGVIPVESLCWKSSTSGVKVEKHGWRGEPNFA